MACLCRSISSMFPFFPRTNRENEIQVDATAAAEDADVVAMRAEDASDDSGAMLARATAALFVRVHSGDRTAGLVDQPAPEAMWRRGPTAEMLHNCLGLDSRKCLQMRSLPTCG